MMHRLVKVRRVGVNFIVLAACGRDEGWLNL